MLKDYFPNGEIPKLALALEFEDNLHEWQDAWYEVSDFSVILCIEFIFKLK